MIGIQIAWLPPTGRPVSDQEWWSYPKNLCLTQQWIYDFFNTSVDNHLILNMVYQDPVDSQDCNTAWADLFFSSTMDKAQTWIDSPEFLLMLTFFRDNGYTLTVTLQENIDIEPLLDSNDMSSPLIGEGIFFAQPWGQ